MAKIGILIPTQQVKERSSKKNSFDEKKYTGFKYIISEIDLSVNEVFYIDSSEESLNSVDFVLFSLTSFYDILNIISELRHKKYKSKIIVGGAGLLNFSLLRDYVDIAILGRGEGIINDIFNGKKMKNVWYKEDDFAIKNEYEIGETKTLIGDERSVGCQKKCFFCQYGWKNKYYGFSDNYQSGSEFEDIFQALDFNITGNGYIISAIDGMTEKTRYIINKNILDEEIKSKINEYYETKNKTKGLKLYNIIGFPWEESTENNFFNIIKQCDKKSEKKLNIFISSTHFVPMPMTPMECEPINLHNFREELIQKKYTFDGETIKMWWFGNQTTSPISALEECILMRSDYKHLKLLENIFLNKKYLSSNFFQKIRIIKNYIPENLYGKVEKEKILDYIKYERGFENAKKEFYRRRQQ